MRVNPLSKDMSEGRRCDFISQTLWKYYTKDDFSLLSGNFVDEIEGYLSSFSISSEGKSMIVPIKIKVGDADPRLPTYRITAIEAVVNPEGDETLYYFLHLNSDSRVLALDDDIVNGYEVHPAATIENYPILCIFPEDAAYLPVISWFGVTDLITDSDPHILELNADGEMSYPTGTITSWQ